MTFEQIDLLVRRANPVPDPTVFAPVHRVDPDRDPEGGAMTTAQPLDLQPATTPERGPGAPPRRPWRPGHLAAAAAVVAIIALSWAVLGDDSEDTTTARQPTLVADGFVAAYAVGDVDAATAHLTDDALAQLGGVAGLQRTLQWNEASGFQVLAEPCDVEAASTTVTIVTCPYAFHALRSEELGSGPYGGGSHFELSVAGGRITSVADETAFEPSGFAREIAAPFQEWLADRHPGDLSQMFVDDDLTHPRTTDSSSELWETRTREYVDEVMG